MESALSSDTPFDVQGYVTDPQRVGYQVLTNYESTYWRALLGNDAWGLFEVLRSFCHANNKTCFPSIRYLQDILGFKDKRALIGRVKTVKGKEYRYPGLIEILQDHDLVVAEVKGEEPTTYYVFHVNLTPALLTEKQRRQLPGMLQEKHAELLKRCEEAQRELESKKRPPRFADPPSTSANTESEGGVGNSHGGGGNFPWGGGNFPPKQYPINNTHETTRRSDLNNNNSNEQTKPDPPVVVALVDLGLGKRVSKKLAQQYSATRIEEKLDYLSFLQQTAPDKISNPRGWLRTAIEEDYGPPDGYRTAAERECEAVQESQRQEALLQQMEVKLSPHEQEDDARPEDEIWQKLLVQLRPANAGIVDLLQGGRILHYEGNKVEIGVPGEKARAYLSEHEGTHRVVRNALAAVIAAPVELNISLIARDEQTTD